MAHPAPVEVETKNLFRLDGRTILISGGAGAVGTTVAKAILESGGDVVCLDRVSEPDPAIWKTIKATADANGGQVSYYSIDVTDADSVPPIFDKIRSTLRYPIRGLVACAGISGECDAVDYPATAFRRIVDINITGTFLITQAAAKEIHKANVTGSIVIVASMSGWITNKGLCTAPYNSSKSALHQLARSLAMEWGHPQNLFPGTTYDPYNNPDHAKNGPPPQVERPKHPPIRVNTLSPGHINTPISQAARDRGLTTEWEKQNMLGRVSEVNEFRAPVLFLLGDGSSYMTGADLRCDGGHCAW